MTTPKLPRTKAREIEKKFTETIKGLSKHMHGIGHVPADFIGYKVPAGSFKDNLGRDWQIQAHAIISKKHKIKKNEIVPMIRKWAVMLKLRILLKYITDWSNK